jgi:hypothetical protein
MTSTKSIDKTNALRGVVPDPAIWMFVQAAVVANLLVATLVLVVFTAMEFGDHRGALHSRISRFFCEKTVPPGGWVEQLRGWLPLLFLRKLKIPP